MCTRKVLFSLSGLLILVAVMFAGPAFADDQSVLPTPSPAPSVAPSVAPSTAPTTAPTTIPAFPPIPNPSTDQVPTLPSAIPGQQSQQLQQLLQGLQGQPTQPTQPTQPVLPASKPSAFEDYIAGNIPTGVNPIKQFGYDLFVNTAPSFLPSVSMPVGPDYVVGPGDEIKINVWGKIEGFWDVVVDKDGNITLPKIGTLGVAGLSFNELKDVLRKQANKYYSGFEMNVTMGSLRSMRIYVVGNAVAPGAYNVSSLSTIVSALFQVGGPSKTGSMRDIRLERNGKEIVRFDLYDFLLKGDKSKDVRLMPEDVIFISPIGTLVGIAGNVKNPAIYEIGNEKTTVSQLIDMAGGLTEIAFTGRVTIERLVDNGRQTVFESDIPAARDLQVKPGDVVKVFVAVQDKRYVRITGAVSNEGQYGYSKGMTVKDLISIAGGMKYFAYTKQAELTRVRVTPQGPATEKLYVDLDKALAGDPKENLPLIEDDYLFVRTVPEWDLYKIVTLTGEVKFPGTYTITKGEKLSSLIERAGGFTDYSYLRGAVFVRQRVKVIQQKALDEMAARLERALIANANLDISSATSAEEVQASQVQVAQSEKFIEMVKSLQATGRMTISLANPRLLKGTEYDIELEDGDTLYIPMKDSVVNVVGAVMSQGSYVYSENKDWKDYVDISGGYEDFADTSNIYVLKADGTARKLSSSLFGWNPSRSRWEVSAFGETRKEIEPEDTIVVPEQVETVAWLRSIKDIGQIMMEMAVTAGVVIKLF